MSGERTEQPTERRRAEARRRGQGVGRSHELAMGLTLGVSILGAAALLPGAGRTLAASLQQAIESIGGGRASSAQMTASFGQGMSEWLQLVGPLALLVAFAGVVANLAGGGLVLSLESVRFDGSRLNPIQGMRRLVDGQALVRLVIATAKLVILAAVSWQVAASSVPAMLAMSGAGIGPIGGVALGAVYQLGISITVLIAAVAALDFVVQRRRAMSQLRVSKDELRRDLREQEGDPVIRAARRRRARQMAHARMMQAVPSADVVVTNPTHLAVALKYDSLTMRAPRIVAKGQRLMAERIKEVAREHRVPIVEDKPLARALFPKPLGSEIPVHLYQAVARLLVLVQEARFGVRRSATSPTSTRPASRGATSPISARPVSRGAPTPTAARPAPRPAPGGVPTSTEAGQRTGRATRSTPELSGGTR